MKITKKIYIIAIISLILSICIITIINLISSINNHQFENLKDLEKYSLSYTQDYKIENNSWRDPLFINFYKKTLKPSFSKKILVALGIKKDPIWNPKSFKNLLEKVTLNRKNKKLKSPFDQEIKLKKGDRCIVWGDLHGAFHSMARDLIKLHKMKILDDNLKIIPKNVYFIILGDAISRSPYSLELLNILLLLLDKNPEKVIYLRGNHEKNDHWKNFSMRRAIIVMFWEIDKINPNVNTVNAINQFFSTLPDSLTIKIPGEKNDKIFCTYKNRKKRLKNDPNIKFVLSGEKRLDVLKKSSGMEFVGYTVGAATWSILSCPTVVYKRFFNFFYDSFVELTIGQSAATSILTLYNRDTRIKNSLYKQTNYNPVFGYKLAHKVSDMQSKNIYTFGSTMSLSGIVGPLGRENKLGLETALLVNNTSKSNNLIKPLILDDEYIPRLALANVKTIFKKYKIDTIVIPTGTPTLAHYLDMVKSGDIAVLFPYTGAIQFRKKEIKNIVNFRASYTDEIKSSINYLVKKRGIKSFAFFYQNDSYGQPIAQAAIEELKKLGIKKWLRLPHRRTQLKFKSIIEKIKKDMPEAIGCFSSHSPTKEFITQLGTDFFSGRVLFGVSFLYSQAFQRFLNNRGIGFVLTMVVPDPFTSQLEIVKEFRKNMDTRGFDINSNSLEGYIASSLLIDAINKIQKPFTKEKILKHFELMKNYPFKGLNLTFNPDTRDLSQPVWLRTVEQTWIKYKY
ncbi:ABC transporter substrate-binding protein [Candidatus Dependentiae bacterium]